MAKSFVPHIIKKEMEGTRFSPKSKRISNPNPKIKKEMEGAPTTTACHQFAGIEWPRIDLRVPLWTDSTVARFPLVERAPTSRCTAGPPH
jgi:hypothetical protein